MRLSVDFPRRSPLWVTDTFFSIEGKQQCPFTGNNAPVDFGGSEWMSGEDASLVRQRFFGRLGALLLLASTDNEQLIGGGGEWAWSARFSRVFKWRRLTSRYIDSC